VAGGDHGSHGFNAALKDAAPEPSSAGSGRRDKASGRRFVASPFEGPLEGSRDSGLLGIVTLHSRSRFVVIVASASWLTAIVRTAMLCLATARKCEQVKALLVPRTAPGSSSVLVVYRSGLVEAYTELGRLRWAWWAPADARGTGASGGGVGGGVAAAALALQVPVRGSWSGVTHSVSE
jgi:hypothetical protein